MTTRASVLPQIKDIKDLLTSLLGRDVEVKDGPAWIPPDSEKIIVAEFVDDENTLGAICMADMSGGAFIGAAMGLLPKGGAEDMAKEGSLSATVNENLYETMNIAASLFNVADCPHVRITTMHAPGATLPSPVAALVQQPTGRVDLAINVSGYGPGRFSLVVV